MGMYRGARFVIVPDHKQEKRLKRAVTIYLDGFKFEFNCLNCTYGLAVREAKIKIDAYWEA